MIKKQPIYGSKEENSGETGEITFKKSTKKHPVAKVTPYGVWSVWSSHIQKYWLYKCPSLLDSIHDHPHDTCGFSMLDLEKRHGTVTWDLTTLR
jgi:hypothetical protein